jgi:L-malate glycosyltransferase
MKILYVSHILNIHDSRFLEKLLSSNHDVLLVAVENNKIPKSITGIYGLKQVVIPRPLPMHDYKYYFSFESIIIAIRHFLYRVIEKLGFHKKVFNKRTLFSHEEFRFLFYQKKISQIIKKFKPDVIHAGWIQLDGLVSALTGFKPVLQMPWGSDILIHPFKDEQTMLQTQYVIKEASHIYCDCDEVKNTILKITDYNAEKISVFTFGIDLEMFNPHRTNLRKIKRIGWQNKRIIIMTRTFNHLYGIHYLLMALPKIINAEPQTRLLLVGTGPLEDDLKDLVNSLDLNQYVHFTGHIPYDQLVYYLNSAEVYVSTSKSDGTSMSLLEAMACQLPVVVSDVPANCEWVKDGANGYLVPCGKVNPISEKVLALLNDRALAQKMGNINLSIVNERADLEKNYPQIDSIYEQMVQSEN